MQIYLGIMRSLETLNPWSLEKMRHAQRQCLTLKMRVLLVGLRFYTYKYLLDISYCIWLIKCMYCIWWTRSFLHCINCDKTTFVTTLTVIAKIQ